MTSASRYLIFANVIAVGAFANASHAQTRDEKVRNDRQKVEAQGYWIYNDLPRAVAEAKSSGKPIVAVLRCVPCEECVKLDDDMIDADRRMRPLLDQFVRVRIISTNGLDLSLFQFDTDQSFAVFLLNADGTIYGRFGTRSDRTEWVGDVSVEGLAKALEGALDLHKQYPANKATLAAKVGRAPDFDRPEKFPSLATKYKESIDFQGQVAKSCIHCHQIGDAQRELELKRAGRLAETTLFPYPHPKIVGLVLDPKEMATVAEVLPGSDAERAGFRAGDSIRTLAGQPMLSIADVQWVLHGVSPAGGEVIAEIARDATPLQLALKLPAGWRRRDDLSWRASTWGLRRAALGGMYLTELPASERQRLRIPDNRLALLVKHVGQFAPHDQAKRAGLRAGDVIVAFDGKNDARRETDLIAKALSSPRGDAPSNVSVLRGGKLPAVGLTIPN